MRLRALATGIVLLAFGGAAVHAIAPPLWATLPDPPGMPIPEEHGFVTSHGAHLYYAVFNRNGGRPVILLHGGMSSSDSWGFEVPRLSAQHEVVVMDSRAHGRSGGATGPITYDLMASDVLSLMDALHLRRASIVGASDGAIIGLLLAVHNPERLDKLFAWGANFSTHAERQSPPDPSMKSVGATYLVKMEANYRTLSPTPDGFPNLLKTLGRMYATEPNLTPAELHHISAPTVIADGEYEQFIDPAHTSLMAQSIPGAKLVIIPKVSHGGPQQDPAAFHHAVAELLDSPS